MRNVNNTLANEPKEESTQISNCHLSRIQIWIIGDTAIIRAFVLIILYNKKIATEIHNSDCRASLETVRHLSRRPRW